MLFTEGIHSGCYQRCSLKQRRQSWLFIESGISNSLNDTDYIACQLTNQQTAAKLLSLFLLANQQAAESLMVLSHTTTIKKGIPA